MYYDNNSVLSLFAYEKKYLFAVCLLLAAGSIIIILLFATKTCSKKKVHVCEREPKKLIM